MKRTIRRAGVPATLALAFALSACGAANEEAPAGDAGGGEGEATAVEGLSGTVAGVGASSQNAAMSAWKAQFESANPDVTVNYDPQGSGAGREQFLAGGIQFAGSDAYLDDEELGNVPQACGELIEIPAYISPIAVAYNVEGVEELNLSASTLAQIFAAEITNWNDPAIAEENPDAELPDLNITPVHRADSSGTTENFTDYLNKAAPEDWTEEASDSWPFQSGEAANQTQGVVAAIEGGNGTIGYADASQVADLNTVHVQVGEEYLEYTPEGAAAVVDASEAAPDRPEYSFAIDIARDTQEQGAYPIVLVAYTMACSTYADQAQADVMKEFLTYVVSEEGQNAAAEAAGSAPISDTTRENAMSAIEQISAG